MNFKKLWKKMKVKRYKFPCIDCIVQPICNFSKPCDKLEMDDGKVKDLFMKYKSCPDCGSEKFFHGPSGGMATNVKCAGCSHWFNMGLPLFIQRIHLPGTGSGDSQSP